MKFNKKWLEEWTACHDMSAQAIADTLTMAGLEVDAVADVAPAFSGVVIGEIQATAPHPKADRLRICTVAGHPDGQPRQVVCGAANARPGIKVPFATVGAALPGDVSIRETAIREIDSSGMLCASQELGLDPTEGLWELPLEAPVGTDLRAWLALDDQTIEVDLTPNRSDCLGLIGLGRELAALTGCRPTPIDVSPVPASHDQTLPVTIEEPAHCAVYTGRIIRNIQTGRPSPVWLTERLRRAGIRSIDPVVDVTNYVLLELGQPMHAFDLDRLEGGIVVRLARSGETLALLDGQSVTLEPSTLVIADANQPLALAGIMGGAASAVSTETRHLFLECAWFDPVRMAGKARQYGLHTDSSHRFERGVDFALQARALERATALLMEIVGGEPGPLQQVTFPEHLPARNPVRLRRPRLDQQLGISLDEAVVSGILERLGLCPTPTQDGWEIVAPTWRFDIAIEQDLIEEIARVHGYNRLPTRTIKASLPITACPEIRRPLDRLQGALVSLGYREVITYSFISKELQSIFQPGTPSLGLRNPLSSDMGEMRLSLLPGLVSTLQQNLNRQQHRAQLFETGLCFQPTAQGLLQKPVLAALAYGPRHAENWTASKEALDFHDLKGDLETLLDVMGRHGDFRFEAAEHPALHPGQTARILDRGHAIGILGTLHPEIQRRLGLEKPAYLLEIDRDPLLQPVTPAFVPVSRFPEVRRDLALLVDRRLPAQTLVDSIHRLGGEWLRDLTVFDIYCGEHIDPHRKSVALGLTFQHASRTLGESEIVEWLDRIMAGLASEHGAQLRN